MATPHTMLSSVRSIRKAVLTARYLHALRRNDMPASARIATRLERATSGEYVEVITAVSFYKDLWLATRSGDVERAAELQAIGEARFPDIRIRSQGTMYFLLGQGLRLRKLPEADHGLLRDALAWRAEPPIVGVVDIPQRSAERLLRLIRPVP